VEEKAAPGFGKASSPGNLRMEKPHAADL